MTDPRDLYREALIDHYRRPRNCRLLEHGNRQAQGFNPLCGDKCTVYIEIENGILKDLSFVGTGCAVSIASASMMTEILKGRTEAEAMAVFDSFHQLVAGTSKHPLGPVELGELSVFAGIRGYPVRIKCATLAWHTMRAALERLQETVATE
jgi:nitrogen fixation NifU-like protein